MEPTTRQAALVLVRNDCGSNQSRLAVLGIDAPIIDATANDNEFKNHVALSCVTPAADTHEAKFVILAEPIAARKIGRAYAVGLYPGDDAVVVFATVRLRTAKTKGSGSRIACLTMVFKLVQSAQKRWRALNGASLIPDVITGVQFVDGVKQQAA